MEALQTLKEDLDVLGQAISGVHSLGLESVPGFARHRGGKIEGVVLFMGMVLLMQGSS